MPPKLKTEDQRNASLSETTHDEAMMWKRRWQTSVDWHNKSDHKERTNRMIRYLHNDQVFAGLHSKIFLNQYAINLKTLLPMVIAHNPFISVTAENDKVYEYDDDGELLKSEDGLEISHDVNKIANTFQIVLNKKLKKGMKFKMDLRRFLRNAICFNRGIFLVGHTINTKYKGSFTEPKFHPYLISVQPYKIKRQAGTTRIDDGIYFFYEYEVPVKQIKGDDSYNQELLKQCTQEILSEVKLQTDNDYLRDTEAGHYDDVKYYKLRNAYDLVTGDIKIFGKGCDYPLKKITPKYSFKNPTAEFIPNELFQPEQREPISDLMMGEEIIKDAHKIIEKAVKHVQDFNTGYDVEVGAVIDEKELKKIFKSSKKDRALRFWNNGAVSGQRFRQRGDIPLGPEPLNMVEYLFSYVEKLIKVYNFQQGGTSLVGEDETATKTQAKMAHSQLGSGDMGEMFSEAVNDALDKYLEIVIQTTSKQEVINMIGDAGETAWAEFNDESFVKGLSLRGKLYCSIDLQSMRNDPVKLQQSMTLYKMASQDPDPEVQRRIDRPMLFEKIASELGHANTGVMKKGVDTKGLGEEDWKEYLKQQMMKAKQENKQADTGAQILPPAPDDEDDIHLQEHMQAMQEDKSALEGLIGQIQSNPTIQAQLQPILEQKQSVMQSKKSHAELHIERKRQREIMDKGPRRSGPVVGAAPPQRPLAGQLSGSAVRQPNGGFQ